MKQAHILIVDDDASNRKLLAGLVSANGWTPILAEGGAEALAVLAREPVDLVLLDMMMPHVDGMAVLVELQKQGALPALPVVVVTAHDERKLRVDALTAGAIDFVTKPIDRVELGCKCRTLLELKRLRDESNTRAAQQAMAELHEAVRQTLAGIPLYLYRGHPNAEGTFVTDWVVGNTEQVTGHDEASLRTNAWFDRIHLEDRALVARTLADALSGAARSWDIRYRAMHPIRGEVWIANVGRFDPTLGVAAGAAVDVTDRVGLETQLAESQRLEAVGQLAAGIAHDFNNILAVISNFAELLRESAGIGAQAIEDLDEILGAAGRGAALVRQLLAFSRKQVIRPEHLDLGRVAIGMETMLRRAAGMKVSFALEVQSELPLVLADRGEIEQLLMNLTVNARDAVGQDGHVTMQVTSERELVTLTVRDDGVGMDEATRTRIFEPFFTTKGPGKGTGLGLSTVHGIVRRLDGRVEVESELGRGTTFAIRLPVSAARVPAPTAARQAPVSTRPRATPVGQGDLVLLVDDERALASASARALRREGFRVIELDRAEHAIAIVEALGSEVRVVVSELELPRMNGRELAAALLTRGVPLVLVDGAAGAEDDAILGPVARLAKPVASASLCRTVREAIDASSPKGSVE